MTQLLMLDAAFPPDPGSLIRDITTVQANGAFLYVWGPFVNGTPAHVRALQGAGLHVAPIVVPGNIPPTPDMLVSTVYAWGFQSGPVFFDFERGSDPGKPWFDAAEVFFRVHGYHAEPYGTLATLGQYDPDDKDWVANWIRTGILEPLPQLPPDWEAWQFVNDININGHEYDASVVSAALLTGEETMTRGDWIAFYRMWMFATGRPPQLTPVGNYDDQFWADHTLELIKQLGDEAGQAKAVDDFRSDYAVDNGVFPGHPGPAGKDGAPGPAGPAGPPGAFEHHKHTATTDPGIPTGT